MNCSDYAMVVLPRFSWFRAGEVTVNAGSGSIGLTPKGMATRTVRATRGGDPITIGEKALDGFPQLVLSLGKGAVGMQESSAPAADDERESPAALSHGASHDATPAVAPTVAERRAASRAAEQRAASRAAEQGQGRPPCVRVRGTKKGRENGWGVEGALWSPYLLFAKKS